MVTNWVASFTEETPDQWLQCQANGSNVCRVLRHHVYCSDSGFVVEAFGLQKGVDLVEERRSERHPRLFIGTNKTGDRHDM